MQQKAGFKTKREANEQKNTIIAQLHNSTFVVYSNIIVEDYFIYWLEEVMKNKDGFAYNSYISYRNIIYNYIIPSYGVLKMTTLNKSHIQKLYNKVAQTSHSIAKLLKTVMNTALEYAKYKKVISINVALDVNLPKCVKKNKYRILDIDSSKTLTIEQARILLDASKETPIHLQLMFAVLMGMRLSEINGLKYSRIDFINRKLLVKKQLGVDLKKNKFECRKKHLQNKR